MAENWCFRVAPSRQADASKKLHYGVGTEGVPLYTTSATGTIEATSLPTTVTDADFRLPG